MAGTATTRFSGTPGALPTQRFVHLFLLSGDMTDGDDQLLLSGDMTDGDDVLLLSGDAIYTATSTRTDRLP